MRNGLRAYRHRTIIVHQGQGPSLSGVLVGAYRDCVVLAHVSDLDHEADLKGEVVVPRGPGVWVQVPE